MPIHSRYFSEAELARIVSLAEQDIDNHYHKEREEEQTRQIDAWMRANPEQLAQVRAEFAKIDSRRANPSAGIPQQPQRPAPTGPRVIGPTEHFHPSHLRHERPVLQKVIDPMAR